MNIKKNFSLSSYNSFRVDHNSNYFIEIKSKSQLINFLKDEKYLNEDKLILGGGSNILFTKNFDGVILLNKIKGIRVIKEDENHFYIRAGSGENWDKFVSFCVNNKYCGIENLSLIPGSVGAAPIQNIGAYGVEVKSFVDNVEGVFIDNLKEEKFDNRSCLFEYRNSIFKKNYKNKFFITSVNFKLNKKENFNLSYKDLKGLDKNKLSINKLRDKIIKIRNSKLPNPEEVGNAGSFFKNPFVNIDTINKIKLNYDDLVYFEGNGRFKISAAWLIEKCGWKGYKNDNIGVSSIHALVLVNYGEKSGEKLKDLSKRVMEDVKNKFDINLEPEVNII
tara:strand:- start:21 stop:1022 length:1002 start_codon:yes stop_codon:yes gene_type:complete